MPRRRFGSGRLGVQDEGSCCHIYRAQHLSAPVQHEVGTTWAPAQGGVQPRDVPKPASGSDEFSIGPGRLQGSKGERRCISAIHNYRCISTLLLLRAIETSSTFLDASKRAQWPHQGSCAPTAQRLKSGLRCSHWLAGAPEIMLRACGYATVSDSRPCGANRMAH